MASLGSVQGSHPILFRFAKRMLREGEISRETERDGGSSLFAPTSNCDSHSYPFPGMTPCLGFLGGA